MIGLIKAILKGDRFIVNSYRHRAVERFAALVYPDLKIGEFGQLWGKYPLNTYREIEYPVTKDWKALERRVVLVNLFKLVDHLQGCTAECGVGQGFASAYICECVQLSPYHDSHFAIDTYEGLYADRVYEMEDKYWKQGDLSYSFEEVSSRLDNIEATQGLLEYVKGRIPEAFKQLDPEEEYRFVHIDVDLAEPTADSLDYFYPRMVEGGIILFDDYGYEQCPGARYEINEFFRNFDAEEGVVELPTGQAFMVKR